MFLVVDGATVRKGTTEMKAKERNEWFFGFGIPRRVIDRIEIAHPATTNMVVPVIPSLGGPWQLPRLAVIPVEEGITR